MANPELQSYLFYQHTFLRHDLSRGDGPVGGELLPQAFVIDGVVQVLHIEVDALVATHPLLLHELELLLQLHLSLGLLLGTTYVDSLSADLLAVHLVASCLCSLGLLEGDEAKAFVLLLVRFHDLKYINNLTF